MIDEEARARIEERLDVIVRRESVRILLAVESGSRAWGFASADSDYDVRFVYVRRPSDYVRLYPLPDVIEEPLGGVLDVAGWDVAKTLRLMGKSNATVWEWLQSPIVYRSDPMLAPLLERIAQEQFDVRRVAHHYAGLIESQRKQAGDGEMIKRKRYLYATRSALALRFTRLHGQLPPMAMPALLDTTDLHTRERRAIEALLPHLSGLEAARVARPVILDVLMEQELAYPRHAPVKQVDHAMLERGLKECVFGDEAG